MKISVIIPTYNPNIEQLMDCVLSVTHPETEIIIVDDGSTQPWIDFQHCFLPEDTPEIHTFMGHTIHYLKKNQGPGIARNVGIDLASGEWILFLDADDQLAPGAIDKLLLELDNHPDMEIIGYNWADILDPHIGKRKDGNWLMGPKRDLLLEYLKSHMDGSVIYTLMKRDLLQAYGTRFRDGFHEDVDFLFKVYTIANCSSYLNEVIYLKRNREGSIINTLYSKHLKGMVEAWWEIGSYCGGSPDETFAQAYQVGVVGMVATRIREIFKLTKDPYEVLRIFLGILPDVFIEICKTTPLDTQYGKSARAFANGDKVDFKEIFKRTWSCRDLQGSLFLAPNEIRTCCKRFFVDGEIRGDVKLVDSKHATVRDIIEAKSELKDLINKGEETPCSGCPFMEFKEWEPIEPLQVKYLSMEQHSVCNMKCSYCDDTYYGGKKPEYDVFGLIKSIVELGGMDNCHTIVWGGGEPTVGKDFNDMIYYLSDFYHTHQRVLTNSLKPNPLLQALIHTGLASIVTSIDAGTQETFTKVRGMGKITTVLENLKNYSSVNPHLVTIKYILTDDNSTPREIHYFADLIQGFDLTRCNFQISCDFKKEVADPLQVQLAIELHNTLNQRGCQVVFFDDLLMQRIIKSPYLQSSMSTLIDNGLIENPFNYSEITVYGKGEMTKWMFENTQFLSQVKVTGWNEWKLDTPVLITGSQGYPEAYNQALKDGVSPKWIIRGVII